MIQFEFDSMTIVDCFTRFGNTSAPSVQNTNLNSNINLTTIKTDMTQHEIDFAALSTCSEKNLHFFEFRAKKSFRETAQAEKFFKRARESQSFQVMSKPMSWR